MHVIFGDGIKANIYRQYLVSTGEHVVDEINPDDMFDLGFICGGMDPTITIIEKFASRCKVLVTPKLRTAAAWDVIRKSWPQCQFVMAKPDLYRPQIEMLRDIRLLRDCIHDIEIRWSNIIGLIHIAHVVAGPLSTPSIHENTMTFENFGIKTHCEEAEHNEVRINFIDGSVTKHVFGKNSDVADHAMIQNLFKLTKFNPGEYEKHFVLDNFVHKLLE